MARMQASKNMPQDILHLPHGQSFDSYAEQAYNDLERESKISNPKIEETGT